MFPNKVNYIFVRSFFIDAPNVKYRNPTSGLINCQPCSPYIFDYLCLVTIQSDIWSTHFWITHHLKWICPVCDSQAVRPPKFLTSIVRTRRSRRHRPLLSFFPWFVGFPPSFLPCSLPPSILSKTRTTALAPGRLKQPTAHTFNQDPS